MVTYHTTHLFCAYKSVVFSLFTVAQPLPVSDTSCIIWGLLCVALFTWRMFPRFVHVAGCVGGHSFLLPRAISPWGRATLCSVVHWQTWGHWPSRLSRVELLGTATYECSWALVSFPLGVHCRGRIGFWCSFGLLLRFRCVCEEALLLVTGASVTFVCDPVTPVSCWKPLDPLMPGAGASYNVLLSWDQITSDGHHRVSSNKYSVRILADDSVLYLSQLNLVCILYFSHFRLSSWWYPLFFGLRSRC